MKFLFPAVIILLCFTPALRADEPPTHSLVRIFVDDRAELGLIWSAGLDFEGSSGKPGGWMQFVVTPSEMRALLDRGIAYDVVEADMAAAAAGGLAPGPMNALGFGFGSMGGYYTLEEIGEQLDSMKLLHPGLITAKQEFGGSVEGRPIWAVKISDNPDSDEPDEPEVLYTALTHAREPAGMMSVIYYMWWLLEQYDSDPSAAYLVDNRQIWFIPVINVDGYAYNESTNPSGGGFWRKNRRDNGNGTWGIDLNRNYGPESMWNSPHGGSSTSTGSDTYRGPAPFSEPETQTIDTFMRLHSIRTCLNYHTYSRLLIYPYGYLGAESGDSLIYRELAFDMVRSNRYATGIDQQTVNYSTRGNSDDYMYGDDTKFRTYAMTPEVGTSFWPPSSEILPLALENLPANIHNSYVAGPMPVLWRHELSASTDGDGFLPGGEFEFLATIRNKGLDTSADLTVSFATDAGSLSFDAGSLPVHRLDPRSDTVLTVAGSVDPSAVPGSTIRLFVGIGDPDGYTRTDTLTIYIGTPSTLFADDAESGTALWSAEGNWNVSAVAHDGALSFHDSPSGVTPVWSNTGLQTAAPVDLTAYPAVKLEYWTKWAIEPTYDFGMVMVSTDSGSTWSVVRAGLSNLPSGSGVQSPGRSGYDGYTPGLDWVRQEIDLSAFGGSPVLLRFEVATDGSDSRDGWYLDDIRVTGYRDAVPGSGLGVTSSSLAGKDLFFGESPGATDGIDTSLGEAELDPPPPPGTFDVRWEIPGSAGSLTDIRDTLASAGDTNVFTLRFQGGPSDYPLVFNWDRDNLPPGGWRLSDSLPGTGPADLDMWLTGEAVVADTAVKSLKVVHSRTGAATVGLRDKWSMVSLPVIPDDASIPALFPDALTAAYSFGTAYAEEETLTAGPGYWIKNGGTGEVHLTGIPFNRNLITNDGGGWILFGSVYCPVPRSAICPSCPAPPIVYGYRNGYFIPDTLVPGEAYWYRGTEDLDLDCDLPDQAASPGTAIGIPSAPYRLVLTDGAGAGSTLRYGPGAPAGHPADRFRLPPVPPQPAFDARFDTENSVEYFEEGADARGVAIRISGGAGDVRITSHGTPGPDERYLLELTDASGARDRFPLDDGASVVIPAGTSVRLLRETGGAAPPAFRVHGNYPNPFNPRTSIRYDLPAAAFVTLRVRNIAGQEVAVPVRDAGMPAGRHVLEFDAGDLPSGVYVYTLTARTPDPRQTGLYTGKFILIK